MTVETVYIARHGFRLNWVNTNWKSETGMPRDPPLAAFGLDQAKELAAHFLSMPEDERPTAIYSSPYYRCLQTSEPVSRALGVPIFIEHGLSEWYSTVKANTGLHPRPESAESLKRYFSTIDTTHHSIYYPSRKGESVSGLHERTNEFMDALLPYVSETTGAKRILLVSHAATCITMCKYFSGDADLPLRYGCCTLSEARRAGDGKGWVLKRAGDGTFMAKGVQRDWGLEDVVMDGDEVIHEPGEGDTSEEDHPVGLVLPRQSNSNL